MKKSAPASPCASADVLILGAGVGGYETFRSLTKLFRRYGIKKTITLLDRNNYFTFTPMLHEAATGSVEPDHCAIPIRELVYKTGHRFVKAEVKHISLRERVVTTSAGDIRYEVCVMALGSGVNYYNIPGANEYSYNVRTLSAALRLQGDFVTALEGCHAKPLTVTVVGGAYTGVELAGQFCDFIGRDIRRLYPGVAVKVKLIQAGPELLPNLPEKVRLVATRKLTGWGVEILLNSPVIAVKPHTLVLESGEELASDFIVWTAGFANVAECYLSAEHCERGRVPVNQFLHHTHHDTLYAVGDIALAIDAKTGQPYPQLGEAAHKEGQYVARHITSTLLGRKRVRPFHFRSVGTFLPLGNWYGVAIMGRLIFFGKIAWVMRRTAYLLFLPGFVRRVRILFDWLAHRLGHRYIIDIDEDGPPGKK